MSHHSTTVYIDDAKWYLEFDYTPAELGYRDSFGAPYEPDYPASIEVTMAKHESGWVPDYETMSKWFWDNVENKCLAYLSFLTD